MRATLNKGIVPVFNQPLVWDVKFPNNAIGDVLVIELPSEYPKGAIFSLQVLYTTSPTSMGVTFLTAS
jgi:hypothetical protein